MLKVSSDSEQVEFKDNPKIATANGAVSKIISSKNPLVGLVYNNSVRGCKQEDLMKALNDVWNMGLIHNPEDPENPIDSRIICIKAIAWIRDPRGGKGERDLGRCAWNWLAKNHSTVFNKNLNWFISNGSRLDDLLFCEETGYKIIAKLLLKDQQTVLFHMHQVINDLISKSEDNVVSAQLLILSRKSPEKIIKNRGLISKFFKYGMTELDNNGIFWINKPISLMAKWAPTEDGAKDKKIKKKTSMVKQLLKLLNMTPRQYRVCLLTPLRRYLNVLETKMCAKKWDTIDVEKIPSLALNKNRKTLRVHIPQKMEEYMNRAKAGEVEIKADQVWPHHLVKAYLTYSSWDAKLASKTDDVIELQWKALVEKYSKYFRNSISLVDVSGSMTCNLDKKSTLRPMDVAIALGLLSASAERFSVKQNGDAIREFIKTQAGSIVATHSPAIESIMKNLGHDLDGNPIPHPLTGKIITFESKPQLFDISTDKSLLEQCTQLSKAPWGNSTNFQAALDLLLETAIQNNLDHFDMPQCLFVFSDMQFNQADKNYYTNHEMLKKKWESAGFNLPTIVYWNLNGSSKDCPIDNDQEHGVVLLSGFSPDIMKAIMEDDIKSLTPLKAILRILNVKRYSSLHL
tara:strand:- start:4689 stop:6575 length:1887 start_codon:yes stop_codon:yes gene_type:complete